MDIKDLREAMKLHQEMSAALSRRIESLRQGKAPSLESLLREKEISLTRLRADVEAATKERDMAMSRWNRRIEQRTAAVATLEGELAEIKRRAGGDVKPDPEERKKTVRRK